MTTTDRLKLVALANPAGRTPDPVDVLALAYAAAAGTLDDHRSPEARAAVLEVLEAITSTDAAPAEALLDAFARNERVERVR